MLIALLLLLAGLVVLTLAADRFVLSATRVSHVLGLSPILVGALVIGFGTSAPEMLVSALAGARGEIDIAVGNVIGSNTVNLTLVLGMAALVTPLVTRVETIRREGVVMFAAMALTTALLWNLELTRIEAGVLIAGMAAAAYLLIRWARRDPGPPPDLAVDADPSGRDPSFSTGREVAVGFAALLLTLGGADVLVRGATRLAAELDISSAFVGLVIVSVGTSLPELATALAAARRGQTDLVIGNVVGSNLFNALAVLGVAGLAGPGVVAGRFHGVMVLMMVTAAVAGVLVVTGRRLARWEGAVLLVLFLVLVALSA
ncbi:MAG: calcium/sodium antiporter [Acidimicrobiia bacterium]|nr:calcium/sodium antiporter [Acidimicrobiia bacterium]